MTDRYEAQGDQGAFEPGSNGRVLRNKLAITAPDDMAEVELLLLEKLYEAVLIEALPERTLGAADLKTWHRRWLGEVYTWAGEERSVNLAKADFQFAAAAQIPRLLATFERDCLAPVPPATKQATPRWPKPLP